MSLQRIITFGTIASIMALSLETVASARQAGTKLQDQKLTEKITQRTTIDPRVVTNAVRANAWLAFGTFGEVENVQSA